MAILHADGFDHYGISANMLRGVYAELAGNDPLTSTNPRTGSHSIATTATRMQRWVLPAPANAVGLAVAIFPPGLPSNDRICPFMLRNAANDIIALMSLSPDGALVFFRGGNTNGGIVELGRTGPVVVSNAWTHIEVYAVVDPIVGSAEVRVNGVVELKLQDVNTGNALIASAGFGQTQAGSGTSNCRMDDLVIWDKTGEVNNDFLGPVQVVTMYPNRTVNNAGWVAVGAPTIHEAIDEANPDFDTTYAFAEDVGDTFTVGIGELPPELISVSAVVIPLLTRAESAGVSNYQAAVVSGDEELTGPNRPITAAYTYRQEVFEVNPATGGGWNADAVEQAGFKITRVDPVE